MEYFNILHSFAACTLKKWPFVYYGSLMHFFFGGGGDFCENRVKFWIDIWTQSHFLISGLSCKSADILLKKQKPCDHHHHHHQRLYLVLPFILQVSTSACPGLPRQLLWTQIITAITRHVLETLGFVCCQVIKGRTELTLLKKISSVSAVSMSTV